MREKGKQFWNPHEKCHIWPSKNGRFLAFPFRLREMEERGLVGMEERALVGMEERGIDRVEDRGLVGVEISNLRWSSSDAIQYRAGAYRN